MAIDYEALAVALDEASESLQGGLRVRPDGTWVDDSHVIPCLSECHDGMDSATAPYSLEGQPVTEVVTIAMGGWDWSVKVMEDAEVLVGSGDFLRHHISGILDSGSDLYLGVTTVANNDEEEDWHDANYSWAVIWTPA